MLSEMFTVSTGDTTTIEVLIYAVASLILGFIIAIVYKETSKFTKNFLVTLTILPFLVAMVIFIVNGSVGTSIAILGAFGLVRFRSLPGTSKEIISVFFSMTVGLAIGMGSIGLAIVITAIGCIALIIFSKINLFEPKHDGKILEIMVPENLDYTNLFNTELEKYATNANLISSKTSNMGSIFDLKYRVYLKEDVNEKDFIDSLRIKNGNLKVSLSEDLLSPEDL